MGNIGQFKQDELPEDFTAMVWRKPEGSVDVGDASAIRSDETGYTAVKIKFRQDELKQIAETGEVFLVLCLPHQYPIPPFWVGGHLHDAVGLARRSIQFE